jgi:alkaline phosphatase D
MHFIVTNKITGIIFLTGDRHYADVIRWQPDGGYPMYDVTSSPLTSGSYPSIKQTPEGTNPYRVVPEMVFDQNYIKISVSGEKLFNRVVTVTCYTVDGRIPWTLEIKQQDLKW